MHALAQIMAVWPKEVLKPIFPAESESEEARKDHAAVLAEYVPNTDDPYYKVFPTRTCTPTTPCHNVYCKSCVEIHTDVSSIDREVAAFLDTQEGRFELWCAKQARQAEQPSKTASKEQEHPSFG